MYRILKIISHLLLLFFINGCASKNELKLFHSIDHNQTNVKNHTVATHKINNNSAIYRIKKYDRLSVTVYGEPDLNTPKGGILVNHRGIIILPIAGRIKVAGLSQTQASMKIQKAYRKYYSDALISVEVPNKKVFVIGDVKKPGSILIPNEQTTLLKAIAEAGGFKDTANREAIYILHKNRGTVKLERLSLSGNESLKNAFHTLFPDDIIYIAPSTTKIINLNTIDTLKIIGQVLTPFAAARTIVND